MTSSKPSVNQDPLKFRRKRQKMQKSTVKRLCLKIQFGEHHPLCLHLFSKGAYNLRQKPMMDYTFCPRSISLTDS